MAVVTSMSRQSSTAGRVLLVTSSFPRWIGDSTAPFVLQIAQDLLALGWDVHVLAPHAPGARLYEVLHGIPVSRFRYMWPESQETLCYQGGALVNLRRDPLNRLRILPFLLCEAFAVFRRLCLGKFDLVHSHWLLPQGLICALAAVVFRVPHVTTVHGGDIFALRGRLPTFFKKLALRLTGRISVNSSATKEAVERIAHATDRIVRIPIGVSATDSGSDNQTSQLRARFRKKEGPLLVYVGRLIEEKGVGDLVTAVATLKNVLPDVTALIVGDGQDRARFEHQAKDLGLEDCVTFTGWVKPDEVPDYLSAADIFVGPSKRSAQGWVEAQGLTFIEAMLAGTPVIATAVGGVVDAVQDEKTGLLISEGAPAEIVTAVIRLVRDPALCESLRANAAALAREQFTRGATAEAFSALFHELLGSRR